MGNLASRMWGGGAAGGGGRRDWAGLPDELVGAIAERLSIPDHIRFRAVCASWASAAAAEDHPPSPWHFPWLMLDRQHGPPHSFVSAGDGRSYRLPGTERIGRTCVGSRDGRLVMLDGSTPDAAASLVVVNPVAGARASLPSFRTLPWSKTFFAVRKVALSAAAAAGEGLVALSVVYSLSSCHLAFARAGDEEWTPLDFLPPAPQQRIEDAVYHDGRFFVVFTRGRVQSFDLTAAAPAASRLFGSCATDAAAAPHSSCQVHLVSSSGSLLQVRRQKEALTGTTTKLQVAKFVSESESGWVETNDLGDQSLFLDDKHSVSLCATKGIAPPMRKNCIYFADEVPHSGKIKVGDLKTFDVGKCTVEPFRLPESGASDRQLMAPIWFIPSLSSLR